MGQTMTEKASKRITCNLTEAQYETARQLTQDGETLSAYVLRLIQEDAERQGVAWENSRNQWGDPARFNPKD